MPRVRVASESDPLLPGPESSSLSWSAPRPGNYLDTEPAARIARRKRPFCAPCCTCWSSVCFGFLIWLGIYASLGWDYQQNGWTRAQIPTVQRNAFLGALLWAMTGTASYFWWQRQLERRDASDTEMTVMRDRNE
jgi:hypothetical protein